MIPAKWRVALYQNGKLILDTTISEDTIKAWTPKKHRESALRRCAKFISDYADLFRE
jgi:hypothetical protein